MNFLIKPNFKALIRNFWFLWSLCIFINIITFLFIYFKIHPGNKTLALDYNILVGVEWYGKGKNLYFIPSIGLAITLINYFLFKKFKNSEEFLNSLTIFVSLFAQIILFIAAIFLDQVN